MTANEIRKAFLDFFASKNHQIVASAPMVVKNDPTLMFINSGMAPFKDIFLGNSAIKYPRVANTQKCLRVSGKHNDLEEVGIDTYHHTLFEMLGNWSFGDPKNPQNGYFKKEAITWAWELLTDVYKIDKDRLYVSVFEGDESQGLDHDTESFEIWKQFIADDRIINGNKKDNFWEMGETGPCGPCTEIHVDLRPDSERAKVDGKTLVNADHPQVVEIWNNVFMQFQRMANGSLQPLPAKHVDTGMGFERLCMALQGKTSNYDTDIFQPLIQFIAQKSGVEYQSNSGNKQIENQAIAMRVIADHIRAIAFTITDGQLPSNTGAGYVIRRILRRAVRYGYTFLGFKEAFLHQLIPTLANQFEDIFPELKAQQDFVQKVVLEEENAFLRTLSTGIQRFDKYIKDHKSIQGDFAFELFDTYGFPIDLTQLLAKEKELEVDMAGFNAELQMQKTRSRAATTLETDDWVLVGEDKKTEFIGYDALSTQSNIIKYRKVKTKGKEQFQLILDCTPFYAESGGQVGDTGILKSEKEIIQILDTKKENNQTVHLVDNLPHDLTTTFTAHVNPSTRTLTENNHSATHLLHAALKQVLGNHVNQKGSLVNADYLRFDFSHFAKVTDEEIAKIESIVNQKIRENIALKEERNVAYDVAIASGVTALFGEKYGDFVRVITFDDSYSKELCGGTHVKATGQIGYFKIISESAVAAGVRRIEAITADKAEEYIQQQITQLAQVADLLKNPPDIIKSLELLLDENNKLKKNLEQFIIQKAMGAKQTLIANAEILNGITFIAAKLDIPSADAIKNLSFDLKNSVENLFLVLGAEIDGKAHLSVIISDNLVKEKNLNAGQIIRELGKKIQGGGGGQAFYATAGGKDVKGIEGAIGEAKNILIHLK